MCRPLPTYALVGLCWTWKQWRWTPKPRVQQAGCPSNTIVCCHRQAQLYAASGNVCSRCHATFVPYDNTPAAVRPCCVALHVRRQGWHICLPHRRRRHRMTLMVQELAAADNSKRAHSGRCMLACDTLHLYQQARDLWRGQGGIWQLRRVLALGFEWHACCICLWSCSAPHISTGP